MIFKGETRTAWLLRASKYIFRNLYPIILFFFSTELNCHKMKTADCLTDQLKMKEKCSTSFLFFQWHFFYLHSIPTDILGTIQLKPSNLASIVCNMLNLVAEKSNVRMLHYIYCWLEAVVTQLPAGITNTPQNICLLHKLTIPHCFAYWVWQTELMEVAMHFQ